MKTKRSFLPLRIAAATVLTLLFVFSLATNAEDSSVSIDSKDVSAIQTEIQNAINSAESGGIVTVTGGKTDANTTLTLDIPAGVTVLWQATYSDNGASSGHLIQLTGPGAFEVGTSGALSVSSSGKHAIYSTNTSSTVTVSGGKVEVTRGSGVAIWTPGNVLVKGGEVSSMGGNTISAAGASSTVTVSGGTVSNSSSGSSVILTSSNSNVTVSETGKVEAKGSAGAISTSGSVEVKDTATVSAKSGYGIRAAGANSTVTVSGGLVFAYGSDIIGSNNVIYLTDSNTSSFAGASGTGIVIACNRHANAVYAYGATTDISISPDSPTSDATAVWANQSSQPGIAYKNNTNEGFIPLGVTVTKATPTITTEPNATNIYNGSPLSASELSGGAASGIGDGATPLAGNFAWTTGTQTPDATGSFSVTFTPTDTDNYNIETTHASVTVIDCGALGELITDAGGVKSAAPPGEGHGQCPQAAHETFAKAIAAAKTVHGTPAASNTQTAIDDAFYALEQAIKTFTSAKIVVDFTALDAKLAEAKAIKRGNYTTATWDALQEAIIDAETTRETQHVAQKAIDAARDALTSAIENLRHIYVPPPDNTNDKKDNNDKNDEAAEPTEPPEEPPEENPFDDVGQNDWFYDDVIFAYGRGLMTGTSATKFSPDAPMARGMIVTVLHRMESEPAARGATTFSDVADGKYYTEAVAWAEAEGIVDGYGYGLFGPEDDITRQDLALLFLRCARYKGLALPAIRQYADFDDDKDVSGYAREATETLYRAGIISGKPDNRLDPKGTATRAEVAAMLRRFIEAVQQ